MLRAIFTLQEYWLIQCEATNYKTEQVVLGAWGQSAYNDLLSFAENPARKEMWMFDNSVVISYPSGKTSIIFRW